MLDFILCVGTRGGGCIVADGHFFGCLLLSDPETGQATDKRKIPGPVQQSIVCRRDRRPIGDPKRWGRKPGDSGETRGRKYFRF